MKKRMFNALKALSACALLAVSSISAQTGRKINANVPFGFVAMNKHMPAGAYEITTDYGRKVILIRGTEKDSAEFALTFSAYSGKSLEESKLIFKRYGDRYFLSQVWNAGSNEGRELVASKLEQEVASSGGKPEIVALLAPAPKLRAATH